MQTPLRNQECPHSFLACQAEEIQEKDQIYNLSESLFLVYMLAAVSILSTLLSALLSTTPPYILSLMQATSRSPCPSLMIHPSCTMKLNESRPRPPSPAPYSVHQDAIPQPNIIGVLAPVLHTDHLRAGPIL